MAKNILYEDHSDLVGHELKMAILRALERCGSEAEGIAKDLCPQADDHIGDGQRLRQSITHAIDPKEPAVYIGTNNEYAAYVELGTGKYYPGGRPLPWNYMDALGDWHHTEGSEAQPYLKPAATEHMQTYRNIFRDELGK